MNLRPISEQLVLELEDRVAPWEGRSPRLLTRAFSRFSLASEGTGRSNLELSRVVQLDLFPEGTPYGSSRI